MYVFKKFISNLRHKSKKKDTKSNHKLTIKDLPVIHQANGSFVADITQKPFYLLHQLGAIKSNIILAPF